jgi:hypothetical protein
VRLSILRSAAAVLALALLWSCGGSEFTAQGTQHPPDASNGGTQGQAGKGGGLGSGGGSGAEGGTGSGGDAGSGGDMGSSGDAAGGSASDGAAGEDGSAASGGVIGTDAGSDGGCTPVTFYPDLDGDEFGTEGGAIVACEPPSDAWVLRAGDCNDSIKQVNPEAETFVGEGYASKNGLDFDYNCDGREEGDTSQYGLKPNCTTLGMCRGSGFAPTGRTGQGIDPTCGSTSFVMCQTELLLCGEGISVVPPKRCR